MKLITFYQLVWAAAELVTQWVHFADSSGTDQVARDAWTSLRMEIRSGNVRTWLVGGLQEVIQRAESLSTKHNNGALNGRRELTPYALQLQEAKRKISEAVEATERFAIRY